MVMRDTEGRASRGKGHGQHLSYWKRAPVRSALSEWPDAEYPPGLVAHDHDQPLVAEPVEQRRGGFGQVGRAGDRTPVGCSTGPAGELERRCDACRLRRPYSGQPLQRASLRTCKCAQISL